MRSPFYRHHNIIYDPSDDSKSCVYEVISKKAKIVDRIPVQIAFTILSNAKLHVLKFLNILRKHTDMASYKLLYMGEPQVVNCCFMIPY